MLVSRRPGASARGVLRALARGTGAALRLAALPRRLAKGCRGAASRRRRAVLTIVHDEPVFLPIWLRYYSRFFAPEDIYVLDHETSDGSTDRRRLRPHPGRARRRVDHTWMVRDDRGAPARAARPLRRRAGHRRRRDRRPGTRVGHARRVHRPLRRGVRQLPRLRAPPPPDREPPLDLDRPILDQRGYWFANDAYDKPALATEPDDLGPGLPRARRRRAATYDPDLRLIHLHRMDYELCRARHRACARPRRGDDHDLDRGLGDSTTGSPTTRSSSAGSTSDSEFESEGIRDRARADPAAPGRGLVLNPLRRLAGRIALGDADRLAVPGGRAGSEHWQRVVMNEAVDAHIASLDPPRTRRGRDQRRRCTPAKPWTRVREPRLPRVRHLRAARRAAAGSTS